MTDVRMPNGMIIRNVPKGTPKEVLLQKMQKYEAIKAIPSNDLEVIRSTKDEKILSQFKNKYNIDPQEAVSKRLEMVKQPLKNSKGKTQPVEDPKDGNMLGFVGKSLLEGYTGLADLPAMGFKALLSKQLSNQMGLPHEATSALVDESLRKELGGSVPSEVAANFIDKKGKFEPTTRTGRYVETGLQMMGGGAKPDLSTLGATLGLQTAKEMDGGAGAQIASAILGGAAGGKVQSKLLSPNAGLAKQGISKAEQQLAKGFEKVPTVGKIGAIVGDELPEAVQTRAIQAFEKTPITQDEAIQSIKAQEQKLFQKTKPISKALKLKAAAETIEDVTDLERSSVTKPLYNKAFLKNDRYIRPKGTDVATMQLDLEADPNFIAFKNLSLKDSRNIDKASQGFENSLAMYNDIKSRAMKAARKATDAQQEASLVNISQKVDNVLQQGTPEENLKALSAANLKYREFSQKIDNIFGAKGKGELGALLKYDVTDAKATEQIMPQIKKIFNEGPENITKYKNVFEKYGQGHKWASAQAAFTKNIVDGLTDNQTLYSKITQTPGEKSKFFAGLPKKYLKSFNEVLKIGSNLEGLKNKAILGKAYKQGLSRQDVVDMAQIINKGQQGRGITDISNFFYKISGKHDVDKEIVKILFDPQKSSEFIKKFDKLKTVPAKQNFILKTVAERGLPISSTVSNKQEGQE